MPFFGKAITFGIFPFAFLFQFLPGRCPEFILHHFFVIQPVLNMCPVYNNYGVVIFPGWLCSNFGGWVHGVSRTAFLPCFQFLWVAFIINKLVFGTGFVTVA